jgi:hypothetical protein
VCRVQTLYDACTGRCALYNLWRARLAKMYGTLSDGRQERDFSCPPLLMIILFSAFSFIKNLADEGVGGNFIPSDMSDHE